MGAGAPVAPTGVSAAFLRKTGEYRQLVASAPQSPSLPVSSAALTGWRRSATEVRALFEGQIINPAK